MGLKSKIKKELRKSDENYRVMVKSLQDQVTTLENKLVVSEKIVTDLAGKVKVLEAIPIK